MLPHSVKKVKVSPLVAIVGPTASGKSALAVALAERFGGEVVSADSRQVYRGLDIGSGKITKRERRGVPHHLLDVANPQRTFTVAQYQRLAQRAIKGIWHRGKLPIICGGTGFYIEAVLRGNSFPHVKPNPKLRRRLDQKTTAELFRLLKTKDPARARAIDRHNKRRLVRALEIATALGSVPKTMNTPLSAHVLTIGLRKQRNGLQRLIKRRLAQRLKRGLINEVRGLHTQGLSWRKLESFGLEYRAVARHLQGKLTRAEMERVIARESWQYARRQMTWFRRMSKVAWITNAAEVTKLTRAFIQKEIARAEVSTRARI